MLAVAAIMALTVFAFTGCGGGDADNSDSPYVGTWKATDMSLADESEAVEEDWILTINEDGTGTISNGDETSEFTWEPTDEGFKTKGDMKLKFKADGDTISAKIIGVKLTFEKQSEGTSTEENTEAAEETKFWGGYGYMGEDPVEGAVYEYMATEIAKQYEPEEGVVSIPAVYIIDRVDNEDGSVDVIGEFEIYNYTVEGDTLKMQSGGSHPGKMHLVKDGDYYKVESFEQVGDGSEFEPTAKKIFGDKYDEFMKVSSDDETMNAARTEAVANYVKATGLEVTKYQDEGWDPVEF